MQKLKQIVNSGDIGAIKKLTNGEKRTVLDNRMTIPWGIA